MFKKIFIIIIVIFILGAIGFYFLMKYLNPDQIKLQYDKEVISDYKRTLDFGLYDLEDFDQKYVAMTSLVLEQPIKVIQNHLIEGLFSVEDLAKFYLVRIRDHQAFKTVIQLNPNLLDEARLLDEKLANGQQKKLFGTLVLIKDNVSALNMNTSTGAYVLKDLYTLRDAKIVDTLKEKDALILGKANLSEWSNFMTMPSSNGFSMLGGQTKNPYGHYDVGGSSSGSSAAAALDLANITIGSETSGSLIYPAGQNSVVALKPTMGLLSRDLIVPISEAQDTAGVIGKNVSDVHLVFSNMIEIDENDPATTIIKDITIPALVSKDLKGLRIGFYGTDKRLERIKNTFIEAGVIAINITVDEPKIDMLSVLNYGIVNDVKTFLNHPDVVSDYKDLESIVAYNKAHEAVMPYGQHLLQSALDQSTDVHKIETLIQENKVNAQKVIDHIMTTEKLDVIVSISNELSGIYAPAGYPALTIPSGYNNGEPFGLTLVGSLKSDFDLLNIGFAYEQITKHRVAPIVE